ncbi:hypothetical protein [Subtercola boreus]|nr:hypothetical protein [Subtercola boreus]
MALIIVLSVFALLALAGIVAAILQTVTDGYGQVATRSYYRRLP